MTTENDNKSIQSELKTNIPDQNGFVLENNNNSFIYKLSNNLVFITALAVFAIIFFSFAIFQFTAPEDLKPLRSASSDTSEVDESTQNQTENNTNKDTENKEVVVTDGTQSNEDVKEENQTSTNNSDDNNTNTDETNGVKPLSASGDYDVVVIDECDIAIKYSNSNRVEGSTGLVYYGPTFYEINKIQTPFQSLAEGQVGEIFPFGPGFMGTYFECYEGEVDFETFNGVTLNSIEYYKEKPFDVRRFGANDIKREAGLQLDEISKITNDQFCEETNLSNTSCDAITSEITKIKTYGIEPAESYFYHFVYNGKTYLLSNIGNFDNQSLQFNSLAPSKPSVEVEKNIPFYYGENIQKYNNKFLPGFELVYDDSWDFSTSTSKSPYSGLLNRTITLSKDGKDLKIKLFPHTGRYGCGGIAVEPVAKFTNGINKYIDIDNNLTYSKDISSSCVKDILKSNIKSSSIPEFDEVAIVDMVQYHYLINAEDFKEGDSLILEVDNIISNSRFE